MDLFDRRDLEGLTSRIEALEEAKKALEEKVSDAPESVRRIARTFRDLESKDDFKEIVSAAAQIEALPENKLLPQLEELLSQIRALSEKSKAKKLGILVVEDDSSIAILVEKILNSSNREIYVAGTGDRAEQILAEKDISLILLDLMLPDIDGRNLLIRMREKTRSMEIPIIVMTAKGAQPKAECFALGADEYFEKPFDPKALSAAVSAKLQQAARFSQESRQDPLTGLPNRAAFYEMFKRSTALSARSGKPLSIAMLDIDRFKTVNDTCGHAMGDRVLQKTASLISKSLRTSDVLARWGGEEFVVLFLETDRVGATHALEKALLVLREERFESEDGLTFQITFSAGVAEVKEGDKLEGVIAEADRLLYLAKSTGRNRIVYNSEQIKPILKEVLYVGQDDSTSGIIKDLLGKEGFKVSHFKTEDAVLIAALDDPVSLAIVDMQMPGVDCFELLGRMRMVPSFGQVPILMLFSSGDEKSIIKGFELGANDYLTRPVSPVDFMARIRRLVKGS